MQSHETPAAPAPFADPTALGLFGLAIGCASLIPIAFGWALTPAALQTSAMFCLLFGAGGQLIAGLMSLANKNALGGTLFTTFAFNWVMNGWALSGHPLDPAILLSIDVTFLVIFVVLTYAFGFFSKLLFAFLLDIDVLYVARIAKELTHAPAFALVIAGCTVLLAVIALWIAFATVLNPIAGRAVFPMPGPLFKSSAPAPQPAAE